jgi:hypothetical protein
MCKVIIGTKGIDKAVKMAKGAKVVEEAGGVRVVKPGTIEKKDGGAAVEKRVTPGNKDSGVGVEKREVPQKIDGNGGNGDNGVRNIGHDYKNYKAVEYTGTTKVNGEVRDISRRVFQRVDIDYKQLLNFTI